MLFFKYTLNKINKGKNFALTIITDIYPDVNCWRGIIVCVNKSKIGFFSGYLEYFVMKRHNSVLSI